MTLKKKIGILGGGQLGKMLCEAGSPWHLDIHILDKDETFPAVRTAPNFHQGDFTEYDDVVSFGKEMDVISIEIEKVNLEALIELESMGKVVIPSSDVVRTIRDKGLQKQFYKTHDLATSSFKLYEDRHAIWQALLDGDLEYPFVQKARRDGYDGRGVAVIRSEDDLPNLLDTASVVEDLVDIDKELALIVARNRQGAVSMFPLVEMEFDPQANLVNILKCPADVAASIEQEAQALCQRLAETLEVTGLLAVELFLNKDGQLLINEVAPRPHNSGHHTIEACTYSQYDLHLRCLLDLPLPTNALRSAAGMVNLLGEEGHRGVPVISGLETLMEMPNAFLHWYGKPETRPKRKMGHITVLGSDLDEVDEKLNTLTKTIKVIA